MGLKNITDFIADLLYSSDKTLYLMGVVGVIVYNQIPAVIAVDIKSSFNAIKFREYGSYRLKEGAGVSNNIQLETPLIFSPMSSRMNHPNQRKRRNNIISQLMLFHQVKIND